MNAYVMGQHDGALPTHLLNGGREGNRVRAIGRLDGPSHDIYLALEVPDVATFDAYLEAIETAGTVVHRAMVAAAAPEIPHALDGVPHGPSWIRAFTHITFTWYDADVIEEAAHAAIPYVSYAGIAAATDNKGHIVVELGHDDLATLDGAVEAFDRCVDGASTGIHRLAAEGLHYWTAPSQLPDAVPASISVC
jgi:hypothetical protein